MKQKGLLDDDIEAHRNDPVVQTEGLSLDVCIAIRAAMRELGMTQAELADRLGISQPAVAKYLNHDQNLTLATLARISSAMGMEWSVSLARHRGVQSIQTPGIAAEYPATYNSPGGRRARR